MWEKSRVYYPTQRVPGVKARNHAKLDQNKGLPTRRFEELKQGQLSIHSSLRFYYLI